MKVVFSETLEHTPGGF